MRASTSAVISTSLQPCNASGGKFSSRSQPARVRGIAIPAPRIRPRCSAGSSAIRLGRFSSINRMVSAASGSAKRSVRRARTVPSNPIAIRSSDLRPILIPIDTAPRGFSAKGVDGWPTRPRILSPLRSSSLAVRRFTITVIVCAERPVMRARSAFVSHPWRRKREITSLSLYCPTLTWLPPCSEAEI